MAEANGVLRVDVVSPERVLFTGEAKQVITRTIEGGEVAFLPGHAAFLGALTENHTRIYLTDGSIQNLAVHLGFVEVGPGSVIILSDAAELEEIDEAECVDEVAVAEHEVLVVLDSALAVQVDVEEFALPQRLSDSGGEVQPGHLLMTDLGVQPDEV